MLQLRTVDGESVSDRKALALLPGMMDAFALSVLESSPDCIKLMELDGVLSFMNANGMTAMQIDDFAHVGGRRWPDLWPESLRPLLESSLREAAAGRRAVFEGECPTAKGEPRSWVVTVSPIMGRDGTPQRIIATSRDVTEQVRATRERDLREAELEAVRFQLSQELEEKTELLAQQKVLLAEIDHRVKNSFALISGILRLQMRTLSDGAAREAVEDAANRISTLAKVHEQLHHHPDDRQVALGPYIESLTAGLAETVSDDENTQIDTTVGDVGSVGAAEAVSVGLIVTEFVANALKNGRPGEPNRIGVSFLRSDGGMSEIVVTDTGIGLPPGFDIARSEGLGMKICSIYASQLEGDVSCGNRLPHGAEFRVRLKL